MIPENYDLQSLSSLEFSPTTKNIEFWLQSSGDRQKLLLDRAAQVRHNNVGNKVYFRGIIEFSNICSNDCFYCGIRRSNLQVKRFWLTLEEVLECASFCHQAGYGSLVLQSGEQQSAEFIDFVENAVARIKGKFPDLGVTLCVGEQSRETYQRFYDAGAHRYLLRMESSVPEHYREIHPPDMDFESRKECLYTLRKLGFQVGTGVMIGAPRQTFNHLARDLMFIKNMDVDMVGMGPYVGHENTPLSQSEMSSEKRLRTSINMIAVLRLLMPDINIASTTALQALDPYGREQGLKAGANVIMPIATPQNYRDSYRLYEDKPCVNETSEHCLHCITGRIKSAGLTPVFREWGDSRHFHNRQSLTASGNGRAACYQTS